MKLKDILWLGIILFSAYLGLVAGKAMAAEVRKPAVAGLFYPGEKKELASLVDRYLKEAPLQPCAEEEIVALIAPHAGYLYSGRVAAYAYKQIQGKKYDLVVLIGPSHSMEFEGVSLYGGDCYETPLGKVQIDKSFSEALIHQDKSFRLLPQAHQKEHSLEVQLPFLQRSLGEFSLLPLLMGSQSLSSCKALSAALVKVLKGKKALLVASSDLSHYHSAKMAKRLDDAAIQAIAAMDGPALIHRMEAGSCELCGAGPVATVLLAAKEMGAHRVSILKYADSSEVSQDPSAVVGYLSAAVTRGKGESGGEKTPPHQGANEGSLSGRNRSELLQIARKAIKTYVREGKVWEPEIPDQDRELLRPGAAFVTLTQAGELRGCIGYTEALYPLYRTVIRCAIAAATSDPRFAPLKSQELEEIKIEISVLSPLRQIQDLSEIQVGRDGILIEKGGQRGLLLPQVATKYHWDRRTFLEQTCYKAGLPSDAWREGAKIFTFSAEIFHEVK